MSTPGSALTFGTNIWLGATANTASGKAFARLSSPTRPTSATTLDAGATIQVLNFRTGSVIGTGNTGANGSGTVNVTAGLTVAIVITGTQTINSAVNHYRLSTIIASVPTTSTTYVLSADSSVAAEAFASAALGTNRVIAPSSFDSVVTIAFNTLAGLPSQQQNYSIEASTPLINGSFAFGAGGDAALNTTLVAPVITAVQNIIPPPLVMAKNDVAQIKAIGLPLASLASDERASLQTAGSELSTAVQAINVSTVETKYPALWQRLHGMIFPIFFQGGSSGWSYGGQTWYSGTVFENGGYFQFGNAYLATPSTDSYGDNYLLVTLDPNHTAPANQIIVHTANWPDGAVYKIVIDDNALSAVVTSSDDPNLNYSVKFTTSVPIASITSPGIATLANPSLTGTFSVKDSQLTTGITFTGTISATGINYQSYTAFNFSGKLTSDEVNATATAQVTFAANAPASSTTGNHYNYVTGISLTNASLSVIMGSIASSFTGCLVVQANQFTPTCSLPTSIQLSGNSTVTIGGVTITCTGALNITAGYVGQTSTLQALSFTFTNGKVFLNTPDRTITLSGGITFSLSNQTASGQLLPTSVSLTGTFDDSGSGEHFDGALTCAWSNPMSTTSVGNAAGTFSVTGHVTQLSNSIYALNLYGAVDGNGHLTVTITQIAFGTSNYTGSGSATLATNGTASNIQLTLTNQDSVVLTFTGVQPYSGAVSIGSTKYGTIEPGPDGSVVVVFTDDTVIGLG